MKEKNKEYWKRLNFIIYLMSQELNELDYQVDINYSQSSKMYWLNPQEHLVLHLMSLINLEERRSRGSIYYGVNRNINAFVWLNSLIRNGKLDVNQENFERKLKEMITEDEEKIGVFEKLCDGKMELVSDKTGELLFYILHYMSVQQNLIDKKEQERVVRILSVFIDEYGKRFNEIKNDEELAHLKWFYNRIKSTVYKYDELKECLEKLENTVFNL